MADNKDILYAKRNKNPQQNIVNRQHKVDKS